MISKPWESYDKAISLNLDLVGAQDGKALVNLMLGDFEEGWKRYEWRSCRSLLEHLPKRDFGRPLWLGVEDLENKTILIQAEQGLGDTIKFCRYLNLFDQQKCRIVMEVNRALMPLLQERNI